MGWRFAWNVSRITIPLPQSKIRLSQVPVSDSSRGFSWPKSQTFQVILISYILAILGGDCLLEILALNHWFENIF